MVGAAMSSTEAWGTQPHPPPPTSHQDGGCCVCPSPRCPRPSSLDLGVTESHPVIPAPWSRAGLPPRAPGALPRDSDLARLKDHVPGLHQCAHISRRMSPSPPRDPAACLSLCHAVRVPYFE